MMWNPPGLSITMPSAGTSMDLTSRMVIEPFDIAVVSPMSMPSPVVVPLASASAMTVSCIVALAAMSVGTETPVSVSPSAPPWMVM